MSPPLLFLDFDDVIVLNQRYGGYDVLAPDPPSELWTQLFHAPAVDTLSVVLRKFSPRVVVTTSWLRFMGREGFIQLFEKAGLAHLGAAMDAAWEAPQKRGETRCDAIDRWLLAHHHGEPYVILDDERSGTGLQGSVHHRAGRVVLCEEGVGLSPAHLAQIEKALSRLPLIPG